MESLEMRFFSGQTAVMLVLVLVLVLVLALRKGNLRERPCAWETLKTLSLVG